MGGSEESSESPPSKESSKSSRRRGEGGENGTTGKSRKKKSKRRSSTAGEISDNEASMSDVSATVGTGGKQKKKKQRDPSRQKRRSSAKEEAGSAPMGGDIESEEKKNEGGEVGGGGGGMSEKRKEMFKRASFSGSTIEKDDSKKNIKLALEESPSPSLQDTGLMKAMGKVPQQSALKQSKYGRTDSGSADTKKRTSFAGFDDDDDDDDDDSLDEDNLFGKRPLLRPYGKAVTDDVEVELGAPPPSQQAPTRPRQRFSLAGRSSSTSDLNGTGNTKPQDTGGPRADGLANSDPVIHREDSESFKPAQLSRLKARRKSEEGTPANSLKSSLTRPGIQRRASLASSSAASIWELRDETGALDTKSLNSSLNTFKSRKRLIPGGNKKQLRRLKMSIENQTFIPPKSRQKSIFQGMAHAMSSRIIDVTLWTYQASFFKVMLFFLAFYIVNIFIWAAVLDAVDLASGGECIHEDAQSLSRADRYEYVFELSWATFTTVGYGTISPSGEVTGCYAIRFTCAFVAFIGVIFASQTAAIMYSKLMRMLAKAHVTFSSTLCVQYGKGNEGSTVRFGQLNFRASVAVGMMKGFSNADLLDDDSGDETEAPSDDGFPIIEFRMINDRANHEGSEIWDAQIRAIVELNKEAADSTNLGATNSFALKDKATGGESNADLEKKVYYPVTLSPDSHPHFSRIWYARHTLNAESPLLKREVRDMIVKDGGKWDKDFNTWLEIRDCLNEFCSLRITISGTSAVSASDVYGEHVYEFDDVCVGWRFANMVYEKTDIEKGWFSSGRHKKDDEIPTRTKIDAALLHDIVPQPGGDHEPLSETTAPRGWFSKS